MHPSSLRAFQRQEEHDLKHPGLVDLITKKQNKTNYFPSWINRCTGEAQNNSISQIFGFNVRVIFKVTLSLSPSLTL
jgi:hypothetical protein